MPPKNLMSLMDSPLVLSPSNITERHMYTVLQTLIQITYPGGWLRRAGKCRGRVSINVRTTDNLLLFLPRAEPSGAATADCGEGVLSPISGGDRRLGKR